MGWSKGFTAAVVAVALGGAASAVAGGAAVRSTTELRSYAMGGNTPLAIVDYFHNHPFEGDRGPALANLRYTTNLSLATRESGGRCRVASLRLDLNFVITLPRADQLASMSRSTRSMWNQLAAFARAHEFGHRAMYLQCAQRFAARAQRVTADNCWSVESAVRQMLAASEAACDARQVGYDQREATRAGSLALFRAARLARY